MKALTAVLALALACTATPPTDKTVVRKYEGTKEGNSVGMMGGHAIVLSGQVPAYYLVSRDNMVCEVDARVYATIEVGHLASCVWGEP